MALSDITFRPPRIETDRVILRGYEQSDAEEIFAYASDLETARYMAWDRATTLEDVHRFLDSVVAPNYERGELDYAVTLRGMEHRCIGGIGLCWRPKEHQVMELGYILNREHYSDGIFDWDKGDYFSQIWWDFLQTDQVRAGSVGRCTAEFFPAASFVSFAVEWLETRF